MTGVSTKIPLESKKAIRDRGIGTSKKKARDGDQRLHRKNSAFIRKSVKNQIKR